jgi:hypothetical protein
MTYVEIGVEQEPIGVGYRGAVVFERILGLACPLQSLSFEIGQLRIRTNVVRARIAGDLLLQARQRHLRLVFLRADQVVSPQKLQRARRRARPALAQQAQGTGKNILRLFAERHIPLSRAAASGDQEQRRPEDERCGSAKMHAARTKAIRAFGMRSDRPRRSSEAAGKGSRSVRDSGSSASSHGAVGRHGS